MARDRRSSMLAALLYGMLSAVSVHKCVPLFFLSRKATLRTVQCFMLNGVMFLGSVMLTSALVLPAIDWYRSLLGIDATVHTQMVWSVETGSMLMFQLFWFLPMYFISLMLSAVWYNDIATQAFKHTFDPSQPLDANAPGSTVSGVAGTKDDGSWRNTVGSLYFSEIVQTKRPPHKDVVTLIMEELYRLLLVVVLLTQVSLLSFVPLVGNVLSFLLCCFVYSFYSFEYKWAMEGVRLTDRMQMLENRWVFLLGFGAPFTLATFSFSFWVSGGIYSLLFPVNIMMASVTKPIRHEGAPSTLPLFHPQVFLCYISTAFCTVDGCLAALRHTTRIPKRVALLLLKLIGPALGASSRRRSGAHGPGSASRRIPGDGRAQPRGSHRVAGRRSVRFHDG